MARTGGNRVSGGCLSSVHARRLLSLPLESLALTQPLHKPICVLGSPELG